jgi:hypothetical protein
VEVLIGLDFSGGLLSAFHHELGSADQGLQIWSPTPEVPSCTVLLDLPNIYTMLSFPAVSMVCDTSCLALRGSASN